MPAKRYDFAAGDGVRRLLAVHGGGAISHDDARGAALRIDDEPVAARARDLEREIGRVDLDHRALRQLPHAKIEHALLQLELRGAVIHVRHDEARRSAEPDHSVVECELAACAGDRTRGDRRSRADD